MPELIRACEQEGWLLPTPVQAEAVPLILGGGDVMAGVQHAYPRARALTPASAAETGSGKTAAFALPVLQIVHEAIVEERRAAAATAASPSGAAARPQPAASTDVRMSLDDRDAMLAIAADGLLCQARSRRRPRSPLLTLRRRAASTPGPAAAPARAFPAAATTTR